MLTGSYDYIDPSDIIIDRDSRQRRELTGIEELAASIRAIGLINAPVIERATMKLVAGERRMAAISLIGLSPIPVQYAEDLDPLTLHLIELEENLKRIDLTWQEETAAVAEYHRIRREASPEWTAAQTADELNISRSHVGRYLAVSEFLDDDMVAEAQKFSTAVGIVERKRERQATTDRRELSAEISGVIGVEEPAPSDDPSTSQPATGSPILAQIHNDNFLTWAPTYIGSRFNLIHCDFPYGVGIGDKIGQSRAKETGTYEDSPDIYWNLIDTFITHQDRFVEDSAHCMFWFSMNFYEETKAKFSEGGWTVQPFPLIWYKSDNKGIMPDKDRQPRRIYETALLMSRGDRKLVRSASNLIAAPTTSELHTSEKPRAALAHFFKMLVDESTVMLDPTCGSGNAICEAFSRGAEFSLGLELDKEFTLGAKMNLQRVIERAGS